MNAKMKNEQAPRRARFSFVIFSFGKAEVAEKGGRRADLCSPTACIKAYCRVRQFGLALFIVAVPPRADTTFTEVGCCTPTRTSW